MKLFGRTGGYYLFWTGVVYLLAGMYNIFVQRFDDVGVLQILWIAALVFPFTYPPFGRWLNLDVTWDQKKMFNWFGNKDNVPSNVVKFPEPKAVPYIEPPKKEEPAKIYYRFGMTDNNRVAFSMGHTEVTMNKQGCQNLIDELTFYMNKIQDEDFEEN